MSKMPDQCWKSLHQSSHILTFRVYSECNGGCQRVFRLHYKAVTWKNLLRNIFGSYDIKYHQPVPNIYYFDDNCKRNEDAIRVTSRSMKELARTALVRTFQGESTNLLVPDFQKYSNFAETENDANEIKSLLRNSEISVDPNTDLVRKKEFQVTDVMKIFASEIDESLKAAMQTKLNTYVCNNFENILKIEKPVEREELYQEEGELHIKRLNNAAMMELLKQGTSIILPTENNKFLLVNFVKDPFKLLNGMRLDWLKRDVRSYECEELNIPISISKELNYMFARDAEFVKNFAYHLSCAEQYAKQQSEYDKKKIKKCKYRSSDVFTAALSTSQDGTSGLQAGFSKLSLNESTKETEEADVIVDPVVPSSPVNSEPTSRSNDATANPPKWFCDYLNEFKTQILQDVQNTVKSLMDVPATRHNEIPSTSEGLSRSNKSGDSIWDYGRHLKGYDGCSSGKQRAADTSSSSKKKLLALTSKREYNTNKMEKMMELGYGLFVISKAGFKIRMPRNASFTLRLILVTFVKCGKYRTSLEEQPELRVHSVSDGIECCIKSSAKNGDKVNLREKCSNTYYDVRIKTKDKSGKFRLCFNVMHHGKVRGHSFKIDVRVRKVYTLSNAPDLIDLSSEEASRYDSKLNEGTGASASHVLGGLLSADAADEGIGGNQEDFYSPTSDSEDSDVEEHGFSNSKLDLPKDEGIDTCFHSTNFNEIGPVADESTNDTDSDTNSSISFLTDEKEARDIMNEALDVVNLPSCFIPNSDLNEDVLPVRIKRKRNDAKYKSNQEEIFVTAVDDSNFNSHQIYESHPPTDKATDLTKNSDDESIKPCSNKNEAEEHAFYRSIYPNLKGLKEFVNPIAENEQNKSTSSDDIKAQNSASGLRFEPYPVNILPEKVFETVSNVWKTVYNTKKSLTENENFSRQVQETVSTVFNSVSSEINNVANAAINGARVNTSDATISMTNPPTGAPAPTPSVSSTTFIKPTIATTTDEDQTNSSLKGVSSSDDIPLPASHESTTLNQSSTVTDSAASSSGVKVVSDSRENTRKTSSSSLESMYKNLPENIREKLIYLNDMGFVDDPYTVYLLQQYPNDLSRVIENLLNYSTV